VEPLTAEEILWLWERGQRQHPAERVLTLLSHARADVPFSALSAMTVGESETALLELRVRTLGRELRTLDTCPTCATKVELEVDAQALASAVAPAALPEGDPIRTDAGGAPLDIDIEGWHVRFRPVTIGDLAGLAAEVEPGLARQRLLRLCVDEARGPDGETVDPAVLPSVVQERIAAAMDQADPAARLTTTIECPSCGQIWEGTLEVATLFWQELAMVARRLLGEVHELASRYGWSEDTILRMSATRRHAYMAGAWA
jgi:hypothetical protein